MRLWAREQARNPNQHEKECQHERHQTYRKPCLAIDQNGNRRECKRDGREYRPKQLVGRNSLWNQVSRHTKVEHLTQRKRNGTDPESKARQSAEHYRPGCTRFSRGVEGIDGRCGDDARDAGQ